MAAVALDSRPLRWGAGAMLAAGALLPALPGNPGLPCPLRTVTGIPCPFCGMTTSVKDTLGLRLADAIAANPGGVLLVILALVLIVVRPSRLVSIPTAVIGAGVAFLWVWELQRFDLV